MPNDHFRFKQFTVRQDKCAMKVCTDACLFGAWVATQSSQFTVHSLLDVGTGTGLLSLMVAQKKTQITIDAIEIDEAASQQAKENFEASPWKERLNVYNESIQQFTNLRMHELKYDLLISNPPFYENDLKSDDAKRNLALHSAGLKLEELIIIADKLLNDDGSFFVLLPYNRTKDFEALIEGRFFVKKEVLVKQTEKHNYFRSMFWLTKKPAHELQSGIIITGKEGEYTTRFYELLKDYYLYL